MLKLIRLFPILILAAALSGAAQASDWPQFRGPDANGISPEKGINKDWKAKLPKELWTVALTDDGFAGPSVAKKKLFIIDHRGDEDVVRAIDVTTGKDVWTFKYPEPPPADTKFGHAGSTPTYDNGKLYTVSRKGTLNCIDAEKGTKIWSHNLRADFGGQTGNWEYAWSPVVDGKKLIIQPGGAKGVMALDKETGKEIWSGGGPDASGYATAVPATIDNVKEYVIFTGAALIGVDAEKGGPSLWKIAWPTSYGVNAAMPIVMGDNIFITSGYGTGCALISVKGGTAQALWKNKDLKSHFNAPVLLNGKIYGIGDGFGLVCMDPKTGASAWKQTGFDKGGLMGIDDVLIAINGAEGDVVMVADDTSAYKELGRFKPLGGQSWTAPIVSDGKLFVRNRQKLGCYDLSK